MKSNSELELELEYNTENRHFGIKMESWKIFWSFFSEILSIWFFVFFSFSFIVF